MIEELKKLQAKFDHVNEELTPDDVKEWRTHPVTQQLFRDAKSNYLNLLDYSNDVPLTTEAIAIAAQAKGERDLTEWLLDWSIEDENQKDDTD